MKVVDVTRLNFAQNDPKDTETFRESKTVRRLVQTLLSIVLTNQTPRVL
jgi:hypothetical protein